MTEATRLPTKEITNLNCKLYKLASVSDGYTLTAGFGTIEAVFISAISSIPVYTSYTSSGSVITIETGDTCNMDVMVWGE